MCLQDSQTRRPVLSKHFANRGSLGVAVVGVAYSIGWAFGGLDTGTPRAGPGGRNGAGRMGVHEGTGVSSDLQNEMASSGRAGRHRAERHRSSVVGEG